MLSRMASHLSFGFKGDKILLSLLGGNWQRNTSIVLRIKDFPNYKHCHYNHTGNISKAWERNEISRRDSSGTASLGAGFFSVLMYHWYFLKMGTEWCHLWDVRKKMKLLGLKPWRESNLLRDMDKDLLALLRDVREETDFSLGVKERKQEWAQELICK